MKVLVDQKYKIALILLLLAAITIRVINLTWGLPFSDRLARPYHPDEQKIIIGALSFPNNIQTNRDFRYPTFMHNSLGLLSLPVKHFVSILPVDFDVGFFHIYLMGRIYSVIAGVGAIIVVYLLSKRLFDTKTGILAAALTSFSLYHVQASAWATVDTMSSLLMVAFIFVAYLAIYDFKNLVSFTGAGIVFGMLFGTRYTGGIAAIVFLVF